MSNQRSAPLDRSKTVPTLPLACLCRMALSMSGANAVGPSWIFSVCCSIAKRLNPEGRRFNRVFAIAQELAEEVRDTADRVHQQAREAIG